MQRNADNKARARVEDDERWMAEALAQARLGEGGTRPNPPVGAVLVSPRGDVLSRGFHARAGGPHAERACLDAAPPGAARGATLYVTLEPCSTTGRTGPCTEAICAAGVARVVFAVRDENPRHAGRAADILRARGISVSEGVLADEARTLLEPFFHSVRIGLPRLTLKLAQSLDGGVADHAGRSKWVTGEAAREEVAAMRRRADAVLVGSGTVLADDPSLRRRRVRPDFTGLPGLRAVADSRGRVPPTARIFTDGHADETVMLTTPLCPPRRAADWRAAGATVLEVPPHRPKALLEALRSLDAMEVLCEGGPTLASSFLAEGLVDELDLFLAPLLLGGGALRSTGSVPFDLPSAPRFNLVETRRFGDDLLLRLLPKRPGARAVASPDHPTRT